MGLCCQLKRLSTEPDRIVKEDNVDAVSIPIVVVSAVHAALTTTHQRKGHAQLHKPTKDNINKRQLNRKKYHAQRINRVRKLLNHAPFCKDSATSIKVR